MSTLPERPTTPISVVIGMWIVGILVTMLVIWWVMSTIAALIKLVLIVAIVGAIVYVFSRRGSSS